MLIGADSDVAGLLLLLPLLLCVLLPSGLLLRLCSGLCVCMN
jgi:hypothetical protein